MMPTPAPASVAAPGPSLAEFLIAVTPVATPVAPVPATEHIVVDDNDNDNNKNDDNDDNNDNNKNDDNDDNDSDKGDVRDYGRFAYRMSVLLTENRELVGTVDDLEQQIQTLNLEKLIAKAANEEKWARQQTITERSNSDHKALTLSAKAKFHLTHAQALYIMTLKHELAKVLSKDGTAAFVDDLKTEIQTLSDTVKMMTRNYEESRQRHSQRIAELHKNFDNALDDHKFALKEAEAERDQARYVAGKFKWLQRGNACNNIRLGQFLDVSANFYAGMQPPAADKLYEAEKIAEKALELYERNVAVLIPENFAPVDPATNEIFQQRLEEYHTDTDRLRPNVQEDLEGRLALHRDNLLSRELANRPAPASSAAADPASATITATTAHEQSKVQELFGDSPMTAAEEGEDIDVINL
jgi:hypothetical protein